MSSFPSYYLSPIKPNTPPIQSKIQSNKSSPFPAHHPNPSTISELLLQLHPQTAQSLLYSSQMPFSTKKLFNASTHPAQGQICPSLASIHFHSLKAAQRFAPAFFTWDDLQMHFPQPHNPAGLARRLVPAQRTQRYTPPTQSQPRTGRCCSRRPRRRSESRRWFVGCRGWRGRREMRWRRPRGRRRGGLRDA